MTHEEGIRTGFQRNHSLKHYIFTFFLSGPLPRQFLVFSTKQSRPPEFRNYISPLEQRFNYLQLKV